MVKDLFLKEAERLTPEEMLLELVYRKEDGTVDQRVVTLPIIRETKAGKFIIVGKDTLRDDVRSFRVDRIVSLKISQINKEEALCR